MFFIFIIILVVPSVLSEIRHQIIMKTFVLMFVFGIVSANAFGFCTNSVAWDQEDVDVRQYVCENSSFSSYTSAWDKFNDKLNFTLQDDLVKTYWFMRNQSQAAGFTNVNGTLINGGFVFTSEYDDILLI